MKYIEKARSLRKIIESASSILDDKTASSAPELFPKLKYDGSLVKAGTRIQVNGTIKKATVDLWDTEENSPSKSPTLWEDLMYREGIRVIPDTITVTSAFSKDELGWWGEEMYKSKVDSNVYNPSQYSQNWEKVSIGS